MQQPQSAREREEAILAFWKQERVFERSVEERPKNNPYVFYDGPPFATGTPHYGHIVASTIKDVVPRYFTMRGKRIERVWGWDCHGLPIENIVEKDFELGSKANIEAFGVEKFNASCRSRVLEYADEWEKVIHRLGRWVDMEHAYRTMDPAFMESVWWGFKQLYDKGAVYEGFRPIHICPRCATVLSQSEVGQGYKDVTDPSLVVRFRLRDEKDTFVLVWTTTPWTLPGNMLLAIAPNERYLKVKQRNEQLIVAKSRAQAVLDGAYEVVGELSSSELAGKMYEPLFSYFADRKGAFRVVEGAFVSMEEGTGIVHIAPGFGEDDFALGQREGLEIIRHIYIDGTMADEVTDFAGQQAKESDEDIVEWLTGRGMIYSASKIRHSYPHCWRCDTPLLNYATTSWFIKVAEIRDELLKLNQDIHWVPEYMKHGRFENWLEGVRDWSVSRSRYWGTPLPIWRAEDGDVIVVGSVAQLKELSGVEAKDIHKHVVDAIEIQRDGKTFRRVPEVFDCWIESGSMPFAQVHYPFENRDEFEKGFPAEFIAEGV
ncbi:isoleucine--tRNA ligase, partial [Candidatus Uhrbacteria bacterium]|nr:isoleucine--tRNA ligase [Candidatus Uhrbacteria bacterium]